jgi:two-component system response regulator VicR
MPRSLEPPEPEREAVGIGRAMARSGVKILLVDDDRDLVEALALRLQLAGFTPVPVVNLPGAIQSFESEQPDLAVLHVDPGPWSGLDLLKELRRRSQTPILMLTGCASESVEALTFEFGADDYLEKPISAGHLIARIRRVLAQYGRAQEQAETHVQLKRRPARARRGPRPATG